jgi:hypothetical protein
MDEFTIEYGGGITDAVTAGLTNTLLAGLESEGAALGLRRKVCAQFIEQLQNVQRYSQTPHRGVIRVGREAGRYYVETRNVVSEDARRDLRSLLDSVKSLSPDELRARYRSELKEPRPGLESRPGLGILYLANVTKTSFSYAFSHDRTDRIVFTFRTYAEEEND